MFGTGLVNNRADTLGLDNRPDEESDTSSWRKDCLGGEEVANLVHREPDEDGVYQGEEEEAHKVLRVDSGTGWEAIGDVGDARPHAS